MGKCVKSVIDEFNSGVSICRNNCHQSDMEAPFLTVPSGGREAFPPAPVATVLTKTDSKDVYSVTLTLCDIVPVLNTLVRNSSDLPQLKLFLA